MMLKLLPLSLMAVQCVMSMRFVMYVDEYHTKNLPGSNQTKGITHVNMAFAKSELFNSNNLGSYQPFESVSRMRDRFSPDTKILVSVGGWADTAGFSKGAETQESRERYAKNVAKLLKQHDFDGVDIDWEYPGGNGADYKQIPNSKKKDEIKQYPLFLEAIRKAIGKDKLLSIAVPGKKVDMIAYTQEQGPKIWKSVDFVNVMSYDLFNRRDTHTKFASGIQESLNTIDNYAAISLDGEKMNLGVAYYAKWAFTDPKKGNCSMKHALGCPVLPLEKPDGSDSGNSGVVTFEPQNMASPPKHIKTSYNGKCGFAAKTKCPNGSCCSQYGHCGSGPDFCEAGCLSDYGTCHGISITDSWRRAEKNGKTDKKAGGHYYFDSKVNVFWTWNTPEIISRKFPEIVEPEKLGGVMGWSLGEDTWNFSHIEAMQKGVGA